MQLQDVRFAGQRLIEAYGDMGFRLSDGRHEGSILILPGTVGKLSVMEPSNLQLEVLDSVFAVGEDIEILILGTGEKQVFPPPEFRKPFIQHNIALEVMDTRAACRTYNILVSEERRVAAAIIAI